MLTAIEGGARESLVVEALQHKAPGYALGARLAKLFPELHLIEGGASFGIQSFADAGKCTLEVRAEVHAQFNTSWYFDNGFTHVPLNAWLRVTWEGSSYEVVMLNYESRYFETDRFFILGSSRESCRALLEAVVRWNHDVRGEVLVFSDGCFAKNTQLFDAIAATSFEQLTLQGSLKKEIRDDFTQFVASRSTYEEYRVPWKRGALFIGPPGNGKTLCVKALIKHLAIPCLYVQSFESPNCTVQHAIEQVFRRARATTPCILVLEDIDSLLTESSRSFFLNELDGFASNAGVITVATTNHPDRLDPAIVERPSRFDRKYHFGLPDDTTRNEYISAWNARLESRLRLTDEGRARVVEMTQGFSFAYIQEVFVSSMMRWMATRDSVGILPVALQQIEVLRQQMTSKPALIGM